ncbi:16S rRNA processing protein RimM [Halobacteriovorax marinus]|uniref:ribosome maturation factor RimM n=1 Tax=Halobacteriovorax marinus TaxID=97084 RepID=UPI000BC32515|nr:ribosome maturation factor RimM [Halobacteriovorax marinus]ATH08065.1 16S rRNA processing protein RimM [Halobacteriovorax marinus]
MDKEQYVELGFCVKPHGIKGGFTFNLSNVEDSVLGKKSRILLTPRDRGSSLSPEGEFFTIKSIAFGNKVITYLEEVTDRNKVEDLIPFNISVSRDDFPSLDEDEFYLSDLVGLDVLEEESMEPYGKVSDFYDNTAQVVLVVKGSGKRVLELPFIEEFFPTINIEENYITMKIPDYIEGRK